MTRQHCYISIREDGTQQTHVSRLLELLDGGWRILNATGNGDGCIAYILYQEIEGVYPDLKTAEQEVFA